MSKWSVKQFKTKKRKIGFATNERTRSRLAFSVSFNGFKFMLDHF